MSKILIVLAAGLVCYAQVPAGPGPAAIVIVSGNNQSAVRNTGFGAPLQVMVTDSRGIAVPGASVTFTISPVAPSDLPYATFAATPGNTVTVKTNGLGIATSPMFGANSYTGNYTATATVAALKATFNLFNSGLPAPGVSTSLLVFSYAPGATVPPAQTVSVNSPTNGYTVTADSPWITLSPLDNRTLQIGVDPTNLTPQTYQGTVFVNNAGPAATNTAAITVMFYFSAKPTAFGVPATGLNFQYTQFDPNPAEQSAAVATTVQNLPYTFDVSYVSPATGSWLATIPKYNTLVTPAFFRVLALPNMQVNGMDPGVYKGALKVTVAGADGSPVSVPVTLTVLKKIYTLGSHSAITALVNNASSETGAISPNELASIKGQGIACSDIPSVTVGGTAARVVSTLDDQITFVVPDSVMAGSHVSIQSSCGGVDADPFSADVEAVSPALFAGGDHLIPALASNSSTITTDNPAARESTVTMYGTGFGALNAPDQNGRQTLATPVSVTIGGDPAEVLFAGAAADRPGATQIKVRIPAGSGISGRLGVLVSVGDSRTQANLSLVVK